MTRAAGCRTRGVRKDDLGSHEEKKETYPSLLVDHERMHTPNHNILDSGSRSTKFPILDRLFDPMERSSVLGFGVRYS